VTGKAEGAVVQTASAEHSGVLTSTQVDNLMVKGRNIITMLQLLPGVVDTNIPDAPDRNFAIGLSVNGQRRNAVGTWMDGVPTQDSGVGWISTANISMDAVSGSQSTAQQTTRPNTVCARQRADDRKIGHPQFPRQLQLFQEARGIQRQRFLQQP
jgi:hypothetical protein